MKRRLSKRLSVVQAPFRSSSQHLGAAARLHPRALHRCPPAVGTAWGTAPSGKVWLCCTDPQRGTSHSYGHRDPPAPSSGAGWGRAASL